MIKRLTLFVNVLLRLEARLRWRQPPDPVRTLGGQGGLVPA
ncbi:hypothetical protein [Sphingomonas sp. ACRSK]|nr:hypothetical protein [Sphingomonas sp. ACRSK]